MRRKTNLFLVTGLMVLGAAAGCAKIDPIQPTSFNSATDSGSADFDTMVVLGDSFGAGFQSLGLVDRHQSLGFAAQLSLQLGKAVLDSAEAGDMRGDFVIPGVGNPGTIGTLRLVGLTDSTGALDPELDPVSPGENGDPINFGYPVAYNNLSVPGATVSDYRDAAFANAYSPLVLRGRGAMVSQADGLDPTFVVLWAGVDDILQFVLNSIPMTPVEEFNTEYRALVDDLLAFDPRPGIVVANVPDLTQTPFLRAVPPVVYDFSTGQPVLDPSGRPIPLIGPNGSLEQPTDVSSGDFVSVFALPLLEQGIGIPFTLNTPWGTDTPLPTLVTDETGTVTLRVLLFQDDVQDVRLNTLSYNSTIESEAANHGFPVVDMWTLNGSFFQEGFTVGGVEFTSEYLSGGVYSLDGLHYTDMAQAVVANHFIARINGSFGSKIPSINLAPLAGTR